MSARHRLGARGARGRRAAGPARYEREHVPASARRYYVGRWRTKSYLSLSYCTHLITHHAISDLLLSYARIFLTLFRRTMHHWRSASRRRSLTTSLCWLQSRRAAADRLYRGPTSARDDVRARRAAARPAGACAHHGGDSLCSIVRERHLAAWREAAASTARTPRRSAVPAWRSARPERGLRRQVARALPRRRGGSLGSSRAGRR